MGIEVREYTRRKSACPVNGDAGTLSPGVPPVRRRREVGADEARLPVMQSSRNNITLGPPGWSRPTAFAPPCPTPGAVKGVVPPVAPVWAVADHPW